MQARLLAAAHASLVSSDNPPSMRHAAEQLLTAAGSLAGSSCRRTIPAGRLTEKEGADGMMKAAVR